MSFFIRALLATASVALVIGAAHADDLKVALIYGRTGPLEAYAKQTETGLRMGLEYATKGKMEAAESSSSPRTTRASPISPRRR